MILLGELITPPTSPEFYEFFLVAIQLGSALAVMSAYFGRLNPLAIGKTPSERRRTVRLLFRVMLGCIPVAIVGFFADDLIFRYCYRVETVAAMLLLYGIAFVAIEARGERHVGGPLAAEEVGVKDALKIGAFQILSLIPGTSRSGSTILGARLIGIGRSAAAEFSFFLSLPVMLGASLLEGIRFTSSGGIWSPHDLVLLLFGAVAAYVTSLVVVGFFVQYIGRHSFAVFGWYRIALGGILLIFCYA